MVATEANAEVLDGRSVYRIIGTVPGEPEQELVGLWVGAEDMLVHRMQLQGLVQASDYEDLVSEEYEELFQNSILRLSGFNEPYQFTAPVLAAR